MPVGPRIAIPAGMRRALHTGAMTVDRRLADSDDGRIPATLSELAADTAHGFGDAVVGEQRLQTSPTSSPGPLTSWPMQPTAVEGVPSPGRGGALPGAGQRRLA